MKAHINSIYANDVVLSTEDAAALVGIMGRAQLVKSDNLYPIEEAKFVPKNELISLNITYIRDNQVSEPIEVIEPEVQS